MAFSVNSGSREVFKINKASSNLRIIFSFINITYDLELVPEPEPELTQAFLFFHIQAEIDETVRKSTNILLTRTLSGCLSSLIRRDNLSLLQLIQVRWNELVVN